MLYRIFRYLYICLYLPGCFFSLIHKLSTTYISLVCIAADIRAFMWVVICLSAVILYPVLYLPPVSHAFIMLYSALFVTCYIILSVYLPRRILHTYIYTYTEGKPKSRRESII